MILCRGGDRGSLDGTAVTYFTREGNFFSLVGHVQLELFAIALEKNKRKT